MGHEREPVTIAILKRRNDADAFNTANDGVALPDIAELRAGRARALDDDHRVHALIGHERPFAALANVRLVIGRRIEILRRAPVPIRDLRRRILLARDETAERNKIFDDGPDGLVGVGRHAHPQHGRLVVALADREADHFERGAVPDDGVENAVENAGIDQMSRRFDNFRGHA